VLLCVAAATDLLSLQNEMEAGQLEAALKQKEAEAAATAQERDQLRSKLQLLQNQILRGDGPPHTVQPCLQRLPASLCKAAGGAGFFAVLQLACHSNMNCCNTALLHSA
jgi:hypothetical protein